MIQDGTRRAAVVNKSPMFSDVIKVYSWLAVFSELRKLLMHSVSHTGWSSASASSHTLRSDQVERSVLQWHVLRRIVFHLY